MSDKRPDPKNLPEIMANTSRLAPLAQRRLDEAAREDWDAYARMAPVLAEAPDWLAQKMAPARQRLERLEIEMALSVTERRSSGASVGLILGRLAHQFLYARRLRSMRIGARITLEVEASPVVESEVTKPKAAT